MTPQQILAAAQKLVDRLPPDAQIERNEVCNLSIVADGTYVGFWDLLDGEVVLFEDED
jgi:hypothetical protein